jgi:hypothetical protein
MVGRLIRDTRTRWQEWRLATPRQASFREVEVQWDQVQQVSGIYHEIFKGSVDVLQVHNFLSQEEIDGMLHRMHTWPAELLVTKPFGYTFGPTLLDSACNLRAYFELAQKYNGLLNEALGFDFRVRFIETMAALAGIDPVKVTNPQADGNGHFACTNIKIMHPYQGSLPIHCGMQFRDIFSEHRLMDAYKDPTNQLSYFVVLQYPDRGGELHVYNQRHCDTPQLRTPQQVRRYVASVPESTYYRPPVGTLFFFNGGQLWHRVTQIQGKRSRVSLSAFTAPVVEGQGLVYWS